MRREFDAWREGALMIMALLDAELGTSKELALGKWFDHYAPAIAATYVAQEIFEEENTITWDFSERDDECFCPECECEGNCEVC